MENHGLADLYRGYIACLNTRNWEGLASYVSETVCYNDQLVGLEGYRQAREDEFRTIDGLYFDVQLVVADKHTVASRLAFNISPHGEFLGLPVNGRRISFFENVFYEFDENKITRVWSIVDKAAIEMQLTQD